MTGEMGGERDRRLLGGAMTAVSGFAALLVPLYDIWSDVFRYGYDPTSAVVENVVFVGLGVVLVATGVRLTRSDVAAGNVVRTGAFTAGAALATASLFGWVLLVQSYLQGEHQPLILVGNTALVGAFGGLVVGRYATKLRRTRHEVRRERDRYAGLFENVPNAVVGVRHVDGEPIVESVNPAFETVFGYDADVIRGENLNEILTPPGEGQPAMEAPDAAGGPADELGEREVRLETDHGLREFLTMTAPIEVDSGPETYAIYIDDTERKLRKQRLEVMRRVLRHNIRNQINIVEGHASMLKSKLDGEMQAHIAATIEDVAGELRELSEETQSVEKFVAGESSPEPTNVTRIVEQSVAMLSGQYPDCTFRTDLPGEAFVSATGALSVAITEAIENAAKHNDNDDPEVSVELVAREDYYDLVVADNGPGIPGEEWKAVVGGAKRTQVDHATGIGLWTVVWIVRDCGGTLAVEQNEPRGSVLVLRLPRMNVAAEP